MIFSSLLKLTLNRIGMIPKQVSSLRNTLPPAWKKGTKGDVILIQGFLGTWKYLYSLGDALNKYGYRIHVLEDLGLNISKIADCSALLENYLTKSKLNNATVVAHSKGGLIAHYFLVNSREAHRVNKVIAIASPFKGTLLAYAHIFNSEEMAPSSPLIKQLKQEGCVTNLFTTINPRLDDTIIPNKNMVLDGADNRIVDVYGHIKILNSQKTIEEIKKII